jgi:NADH-quinone oxidoreductase subunit M
MITFITFAPLVAAILILLTPSGKHKVMHTLALVGSLVSLAGVLSLIHGFDSSAGLQFVEKSAWIPGLGVNYYVGVDGISLLVLLLTALVAPVTVLASSKRTKRAKPYFALLSVQFMALFGAFTALNFFHWFIFWEAALVPAFFLIKLFGGNNERHRAALSFFLFTALGSVFMLLGFVVLFLQTGLLDFPALAELAGSGELPAKLGTSYPWVFLAVIVGLWVKVPLFPLHLWQPAAYAEAPTSVSMILTGVMSKMGVYAFLRIMVPIFPQGMSAYQEPLLALALITILWGAFLALRQTDLKKILAYSSLNHVAYCMLGIFAAAAGTLPANLAEAPVLAVQGATLQMFAHGVTAAGLFYLVGLLETRCGTRVTDELGGLGKAMPRLAACFFILTLCSLGLPFLAGFAAEFLIFSGSFALVPVFTVVAVLGLLATAVFLLTVLQKVFTGPEKTSWSNLRDLSGSEIVTLVPLLVLVFWVGLAPDGWLSFSDLSSQLLANLLR